MNCKPNDLAMIIKSMAGNEGKIVTCIRLVDDQFNYGPSYGPIWETDTILLTVGMHTKTYKASHSHVPDAWLRPIKGLDELEDIDQKELELVR